MTPPPSASSKPNRTVTGAVMRLVAWCVFIVGLPVLLLSTIEPARVSRTVAKRTLISSDEIDVRRSIALLKAANPDYIGIGNSMLYTRLGQTPDAMNALTGKKFHFLLKNASGSATWFLLLKNIVVACGESPKAVFFFIRDNEITSPLHRTTGRYAPFVNSLRGPSEPELDLAMGRAPRRTGVVALLSHRLTGPAGLFSFPAWDDKLPQRMIDLAMDAAGGGISKIVQREALTDRFAISHLRSDVGGDLMEGETQGGQASDPNDALSSNYTDAEETSLLPAMIRLADDHHFKLLFFRVKRRPDANGTVVTETPELQAYSQHLKLWLEERGALYFDETNDSTITLSRYQDGDHIGGEHLAWYQNYFWSRMADKLPK